jgi:hypothetical protein
MTAELDLLDKGGVMILWPILKPYFQSAIDHNQSGLDVDEIRQRALDGKRLIWTVTDNHRLLAALSSGTTKLPDGMIAYIDYLGGEDLDDWLEAKIAEFEARSKEAGATLVEIDEGRLGWSRKLRGRGYRPVRYTLRKAL